MSIEKIERELRENLDGVTKGPWRPGHLANDDHSCDCGFVFDSLDRQGSIATVNMDDGGQFGKEYPSRDEAKANLKHIVAAQPENIRALLDELSRLRGVVEAADAIRAAQRAYMADRGNEAKGKAVGEAAAAYDRLRVLFEREGQDG
jgi:hypothetical protein